MAGRGLLTIWFLGCSAFALGTDPVREYKDEQGNTVREYRETIKRQVLETVDKEQTQQVIQPKVTTDYQTQVRQVQVPVTEWVLVPELQNRWNPFATPYYQYRYAQRTRYEIRQETVQTPVVKQEWVKVDQTVKVPQVVQREHAEEIIRKVVVRDLPAAATQPNTALVNNQPATAPTTSLAPTARPSNPAPLVQTPNGLRQLPYGQASPPIAVQPNPTAPLVSRNPDPFAQPIAVQPTTPGFPTNPTNNAASSPAMMARREQPVVPLNNPSQPPVAPPPTIPLTVPGANGTNELIAPGSSGAPLPPPGSLVIPQSGANLTVPSSSSVRLPGRNQ
jgi:hypothetical protein